MFSSASLSIGKRDRLFFHALILRKEAFSNNVRLALGLFSNRRRSCERLPAFGIRRSALILHDLKRAGTMHVLIKDARFSPRTVLEIGPGDDDLTFEQCTFVGGKLSVLPGVDQRIFVRCLFLGTVFTAQPLSSCIETACVWEPPNTEDAMPETW